MRRTEPKGIGRLTARIGGMPGSLAIKWSGTETSAWEEISVNMYPNSQWRHQVSKQIES